MEVQETDYRVRLGRVIRDVRVLRGVSQADLAARINRSEPAVSRWENGKAMPTAYDVAQISKVLDAPSDLFINPPEVPVSPIELALRRASASVEAETPPPRQRPEGEER